jgi:hypothetical protein
MGGGNTTVDNNIHVQPRVTVTSGQLITALRNDPEFERYHVQLSIANKSRTSR